MTRTLDHHKDRIGKSKSGLALLQNNDEALAARISAARSATATLDLMYYLWHDDDVGRMLLDEVLSAADRGVKVRLLIDDINPQTSDAEYLRADAHPNVEVRLFNPSGMRTRNLLRGIELVSRMFAMTRRMHLKAWIADRSVAIVGGRNIGNAYFGKADKSFSDLDLWMVGDAVKQTCEIFDSFWGFHASRRVRALHPDSETPNPGSSSVRPAYAKETIAAFDVGPRLHWTKSARVLADPPEKVAGKNKRNWLMYELIPILRQARTSVHIVSPYFIPGAAGVDLLGRLVSLGTKVRVITNSLAATDVAAVHGAYANYRERILRAGVKLYEFQPLASTQKISAFGSKGASLHTKAFAIDGSVGFVGTFNFDPRSASLNAEMGVVFEDEALVAELHEAIKKDLSPDVSYQLHLAGRKLKWIGRSSGRLVEFANEPHAGPARRLLAAIIGWLPIESQL